MNSDRVRWGLLSTARINERLIPSLRQSARSEVAAVASRDMNRAKEYAARWEIPQAFGSYKELVAAPDIDAVYLSLPNHMHTEWAVQCAEAGKHVLCEKPLALSVAEVDRMADAAARNGVIVQEAIMMRYHPQTDFVRDLLASGTLGEVRVARGLFTFTLERAGDIRFEPEMGGGGLWDVGSYCVRWFRTVLSAEPDEVFASQVLHPTGVDANFSGHLHFANGMVAYFFCSMASFAHSEADVIGSRGRMMLDMPWTNRPGNDAQVRWEYVSGARAGGTFGDNVSNISHDARTFENVDAYQNEVDSMVSSILDGAAVKVTLDDSRKNTAVIVALLESAQSQRPVAISH